MTIGALADAAEAPVSTVRFYERRGLLAPEGRSAANYRLYGSASLERLRFILAAKDAGFALADIRSMLDFEDGIEPVCERVQGLIEDRLRRARSQRKRLEEVERRLSAWLRACKQCERSGRCQVIKRLHQEAPGQGEKSRNGP